MCNGSVFYLDCWDKVLAEVMQTLDFVVKQSETLETTVIKTS